MFLSDSTSMSNRLSSGTWSGVQCTIHYSPLFEKLFTTGLLI